MWVPVFYIFWENFGFIIEPMILNHTGLDLLLDRESDLNNPFSRTKSLDILTYTPHLVTDYIISKQLENQAHIGTSPMGPPVAGS